MPNALTLLPRALALAAALVLVAPTAGAADPATARLYEDALKRFEAKDHAGAIIQLKNAIKIDRNHLAAQLLLGRALLANGEVNAAEVAFNEAMRLGVDRAEVVVPMANAVIAQGRPGEVVTHPRFALAGLPRGVQAQMLLLRAGAQADTGDLRAALKTVEEARALDPNNADSWLAEVPVRIRARQVREAGDAAERAIALAPKSAQALYLRGSVAHALGDLPAALGWYGRALQLEPAHAEALVSRAGVLIDQRKDAEAARDVAELVKSSPREPRGAYLKAILADRAGDRAATRAALNDVTALLDPVPIDFLRYRQQLLMLAGLSHYGLKQFEKARPYLEIVQRAQPQSPVSKVLAQIYLESKSLDRATESLELYLKGSPNDTNAVILLASSLTAQGRHARAAQLVQDALKLQDSPALRSQLGLSMLGGGKAADAVREFEAAWRKDPTQMQAGAALVTLYMQSGRSARAVEIADAMAKQRANEPGLANLQGMAHARHGDAVGARSAFERAAKLDPKFAAPQIHLAHLDVNAGQLDAARARLDAVLAVADKHLDALGELARLEERSGRLVEAQRALEKADDHAGPQNPGPGLALIDFHLRQGRADLAREAVKRVNAKAPDDLQVLLAAARVSLANADATGARASLTRATALANYNAPALVRIALLQMQARHLEGAAYSLDKALTETPDDLPAQALMVDVEIAQGELAKAERRARGIIAKQPRIGLGHALLGDVARARREQPAALDAYRRAHQLDQSSASLLRLFGAQTVSDPAGASTLAEQWLKTRPRDLEVRRALADGYARAGRFAAARTAYQALIAQAPDDADALNNLAHVLLVLGDAPGALAQAEAALAKAPASAYIIGTVGWMAHHNGQPERALQLLRDARLRDPANPETRYYLSVVLAGVGRKTEAREELEAALKSGRAFASAKQAEQLLGTLK